MWWDDDIPQVRLGASALSRRLAVMGELVMLVLLVLLVLWVLLVLLLLLSFEVFLLPRPLGPPVVMRLRGDRAGDVRHGGSVPWRPEDVMASRRRRGRGEVGRLIVKWDEGGHAALAASFRAGLRPTDNDRVNAKFNGKSAEHEIS